MEGKRKSPGYEAFMLTAQTPLLSQGSAMQFAIFQHEAHEAKT